MAGKRFWIFSVGTAIAAFTACTLNPQPLPPADPAGQDAGRSYGDAAGSNEDPAPTLADAGFGGSGKDAASSDGGSPDASDAGDAGDAGDGG